MSEHMKKMMKKVFVAFCISFFGMFGFLYVFMYMVSQKEYAEADSMQKLDVEDWVEQEHTGEQSTEEDPEEKLADRWGIRITSRKKLDYHRVLLEEDYDWFSGKDVEDNMGEKFSFAYPKRLFYEVEAFAGKNEDRYAIAFRGRDNDALLLFSQEPKPEGQTARDAVSARYGEDADTLSNVSTIYRSSALYIVDGFEKEDLEVYKVVRVDGDNIYTMLIKTPVPVSEDEKTLVSYYTEYMYRSCSFSGSTKSPRSYSKFLLGTE